MMEKLKKLNATGRIAIVVMVSLLVLISILGGRAIWIRLRGLDGLRPVDAPPVVEPEGIPAEGEHSVNPTDALPVQAPVITPEPTPVGWERRTDDFTGNDYLAPPPEIEAEIREAFDAVLAVEVIADRPDTEALAYDREAALEKVEALAAPEIVAHFQSRAQREILLAELGPENPVRCDNFARCTVGRVQVAPARTVVVYDAALCQQIVAHWADAPVSADGARCIALSADDAPPTIYAGVVERCADGVWRVVAWQPEPVR